MTVPTSALEEVGSSSWWKPEKFNGGESDADGKPATDHLAYVDELRLYVPHGQIQAELKALLSSLKQELVSLINRDFDSFVNLSTNLVDVSSSVDRIRDPLQELRATLAAKKEAVDRELVSLNDGLRQRGEVKKAKAILELVQDTTNVVSKVEKLLAEMTVDGGDGEDQTDARSQQLERVSSEYSRLKYYLSKGKGLSFLSKLEDQLRMLDDKFFALLDSCASTAFEKRHMPTIQRCINAYNSVGSPKAAEQAFQQAIIRPIVAQTLLTSTESQPEGGNTIRDVYKKLLVEIQGQAGEIIDSINSQVSDSYGSSCNVAVAILAEADKAVSSSRPNIYSPGIPEAFHANYLASVDFLNKVGAYCPNPGLQKEFQESQAVKAFLQRWNLTVYHSLRYQDIASTFEKHIAGKQAQVSEKGEPFHLSATNVVFECLMRCFGSNVFLPPLANKFCRLSFQLVSRYRVWLKAGLAKRRDAAKTEAATNADFWANLSTSELIMIVNDVKRFASKVSTELKGQINEAMGELDGKLVDMVLSEIETSVKELGSATAIIKDVLGGDVLQQCVDLLKHVRGITATYRMTNRPMPTRASHYVQGLLKPLSIVKGDLTELGDEVLTSVAEQLTKKYDETAEDLLRTVQQTESSLKRLKERQGEQGGGNQEAGSEPAASDADKIRLQLSLDVKEYSRQLEGLGLDPPEFPKMNQLLAN
ncbi:subunit 2 of oligomeric Golgi complex [Chloropicon primus]|uniref:Conserved oligomeric Golgi complex subunit 2 n=1 Tax=Chloropicon primus TaxID=1764295 RepID=A0A5B8MPB3_9CHLO|nr:subunit 2 of oligomeric Golgi complex [Chloropicon primus]UPR01539.1 subunit 2 of oligomeric Golgi complex [Chloropicon primus]|eukprot:QDZ22323.1 subunit 2 of oligomeric Golgi complex [Chloropicon primus]